MYYRCMINRTRREDEVRQSSHMDVLHEWPSTCATTQNGEQLVYIFDLRAYHVYSKSYVHVVSII
jgi:hypothetical protein